MCQVESVKGGEVDEDSSVNAEWLGIMSWLNISIGNKMDVHRMKGFGQTCQLMSYGLEYKQKMYKCNPSSKEDED